MRLFRHAGAPRPGGRPRRVLAGLPVFYLPTDVDVQGVAPVQLGPGQEFWLTQGSGSITFPEWLTALAPVLGVDRADARVTDLTIGGAPGRPPAKIPGAPLNFPEPKSNELVGIINAPYTCVLGGEPLDVGIAVGARIPLVAERGGSFSFTEASGALVIPAGTVNRLVDEGRLAASGKVTALNLEVEGGTPAGQNVIPAGGIAIPRTPLVRDRQITVPLPGTGTLTAGPFTPASGAASVSVALGSATAELSFDGAPGTGPAECDAPSPKVYLVDDPVT
ncbi:hypothetical protein AB0C21_33930 [Spirillospora sp. NPDC049024]